jgi:hypothetical protein
MPRLAVLVFAMFASCAPALLAQSTSAPLTGRVTDPSEARMNDASIKAISLSTSLGYEATTHASGEYSLPNFPPRTYRVEVFSSQPRKQR